MSKRGVTVAWGFTIWFRKFVNRQPCHVAIQTQANVITLEANTVSPPFVS